MLTVGHFFLFGPYKKLIPAALLISLFSVGTALGQIGKLYPVDEAAKDSSFLAFRQRLTQAVKERDTTYIFAILNSEIDNPGGWGIGIDRFKRAWQLTKPASRFWKRFWEEMSQVLSLGGTFSGDTLFIAPYIFSTWPEETNPYIYLAITGENVPVYAAPDSGSDKLAVLSHDIVRRGWRWYREHTGWMKIELNDGSPGFVLKEYTRSAVDYRAGFVKENGGRWLLRYFVDDCNPPYPVARLFPVDEAPQDSSFLAFRNRLIQAVEDRDTSFIYSILEPNIRLSFGGHRGIDDFRELWHPEQDNTCRFWEEMSQVLSLGGRFMDDSTFVAPYLFLTKWPSAPDYSESIAVIKSNVQVHEQPDPGSPVLALLSYDIVNKPRDWYKWGDWIKIRIRDGRVGFIRSGQARSSIDYRAGFYKFGGKWRMKYFIAGD